MNIIHEIRTNRRTAVVTGATSGIGRDIARILSRNGYHIILTGRNEEELLRMCIELGDDRTTAVSADLSDEKECRRLYRYARSYNVEVLINNAGFGMYGEFVKVSLKKELEMLDVNVRAVHILMKLFLRDFVRVNKGYILNVASSAGFMPGPFMSGYYATKNYVVSQTSAVHEELRRRHSKVKVCALCPGPVDTKFNERAGVGFTIGSITSQQAAREAVDGLFKGKTLIIPTTKMKLLCFFSRMAPIGLTTFVNYYIQHGKKEL